MSDMTGNPSDMRELNRERGVGTGTLHVGVTGMRRLASAHRRVPLYWTDMTMLGALIVALCFVVDPFGLMFEKITLTKHLPLIGVSFALLMTRIGCALTPVHEIADRRQGGVGRVLAPLLPLAVWIIAGSLYARFVDDYPDTFLNVGLYMLMAPALAAFVVSSEARTRVVVFFMWSLATAAAYMVLRMIVEHVRSGGIYHELEFLVVPVGVFFALRQRGCRQVNIALAALYLLGGITFLKLTGFLALAVALCYLWIVEWRFRAKRGSELRLWASAGVVAVALLGLAIVVLVLHGSRALPNGNTGYRLITYRHAIDHFIESPVFGTMFDGSATEQFKGFEIDVAHGNLPTHSDLLDLIANGGLIAVALLIWAYLRLLRYARTTIFREPLKDDVWAASHAFVCSMVTGVAVYAFNPILLQPDRALLLWAIPGMLLGVALTDARRRAANSAGDPA